MQPPSPVPGGPGTASPAKPPPPVLSPEGHDPGSTERVPVTGRLRRLLVWSFLLPFAAYLALGATGSVLLPLQIQEFDPAAKEANLGLIVAIGAVASALVPPLVGAFSDRTRSRWGRRAPWFLVGALLGGLGLVALGGIGSSAGLLGLVVTYVLVVAGINTLLGPFGAVLPDRVPRGVRGLFSAGAGLGVLFGALGGQILGAVFSGAEFIGYCTLAVLISLAALGFTRFNPDHDSRTAAPRGPLDLREVAKGFYFNPRKHPDFAFGFLGRSLTFTGYYLISNYQLYLLQDHIGLGDEAIDYLPVFAVVALVCTLISTVVGGPLSDRIGRRKPLVVVSGALIGLAVLGPWISPTIGGYAAYCVIGGLGFGAFLAVDSALLSEVLPTQEDNGRNLGLLGIGITLPQVIAPALTGLVVTTLGWNAVFPIAMVTSIAGAFAVLAIRSIR